MVPRLRDSRFLASSGREARFTQPREHSLADASMYTFCGKDDIILTCGPQNETAREGDLT